MKCRICSNKATHDDVDSGLCDYCTKVNHPDLYHTLFEPVENKFTRMHTIYLYAATDEINNFVSHWSGKGYKFFSKIPIDENMMAYAKGKDCLTDWMLEKKLIRKIKKFQPFVIEIPINSELEYWALWHRMNFNGMNLQQYASIQECEPDGPRKESVEKEMQPSAKLFGTINDAGRKHGIH